VPVTADWTLVEDGGASAAASPDTGAPLNGALDRSLRLDVTSTSQGQRAGLANDGYFRR
jgi:hypothetical protein